MHISNALPIPGLFTAHAQEMNARQRDIERRIEEATPRHDTPNPHHRAPAVDNDEPTGYEQMDAAAISEGVISNTIDPDLGALELSRRIKRGEQPPHRPTV